jgi:hypothetical protein
MSGMVDEPCGAEKTECQLKLSPRTRKVTGGHLIRGSFAGCTGQFIRTPWGQLDWDMMFSIHTEQMISWTTQQFGIWHWPWSFLQNIGTFPPDYILLRSRRRNSSVTAVSTSKYSCLVIIYCPLLTVFSKYTRTGTFLNAVLVSVLTL